ncbi:MAG: type I pullulanase [Oscillospiraceae bacterium]|nr:type I pullulanase [Oscillospiraceae bacterium]
MSDVFSTPEFESAYTYDGCDLGAAWSSEKTIFRVWAPTAEAVWVNLYKRGTPGIDDLLETVPMRADVKGTWTAEKSGDLHGIYYTYLVNVNGGKVEACDPYARTTGVNGKRAMIIDLSSTNPKGWEADCNPNPLQSITDAVLYELHIRDLSMDESSGIRKKGKFLGLIETGTKTKNGTPTGLDHIKELGITHLHLMPVYDYGSVDESHPEKPQFNWGYDPVNFNVPEGSYSSDPFHGEIRVKEMKQMVKGLHDNGISVVMDVVYNHVYDAGSFCFNQIVPIYFSRVTDGVYSNGSGCGNDTASERSMVRKYIVDSLCYWADEYHIDGFRFDLVGLLDVDTINEIVTQVHKKHPDVIFYGEGWNLDTHPTKPCKLAIQENSKLTPGFAYFNDTLRDALRGSVFFSDALGFVTGAVGIGENLEACFRGLPYWCSDPCQAVNYVSCHDNNTLLDRISLAAPKRTLADRIRMNKLAATFYMTAQGIPFLQAGEEMLRSKPDGKGGYIENSYNASDAVNSLKWDHLDLPEYRNAFEYYKGLIAFRKAHPALRMSSVYDILSNLIPVPCENPHVGAFHVKGDVCFEPSDDLFMIFSAADTAVTIPLPEGTWHICIDGDHAGTKSLGTVKKSVTVAPLSAVVLVKGALSSEELPHSQLPSLDSLSSGRMFHKRNK